MRIHLNRKDRERRRRRLLTPAFYFMAEMVFIWLVLSLMQLNFNVVTWEMWSYVVWVLFVLYSVAKLLHVYRRQRNYKDLDD